MLIRQKNCRISSTTDRTRLNMTENVKTITPDIHHCKTGANYLRAILTSPRVVVPEKHMESGCSLVWSSTPLSTSTTEFSRFCVLFFLLNFRLWRALYFFVVIWFRLISAVVADFRTFRYVVIGSDLFGFKSLPVLT